MKRSLKVALSLLVGLFMIVAWNAAGQAAVSRSHATVKVYGSVVGPSTHYIGTCEGNVDFDKADLADLGINTYRIYGGMSRWETEDDDGVYGSPSIAQIKANPDVVPWEHWDEVMTYPPSGSDYAFSGKVEDLWPGSASTIFETLKQHHIRPVLTIRNSDPGWQPDWALQLNPPRTEADWNEWWEHVFATVYWLNVRHDFQVDDFEIHNEPDNRQQGWGGNQQDYFALMRISVDAIAHVYRTYLPNRQFHIHAPKTVGWSHWPAATLDSVPKYFDTVNIHNYDLDISAYVRQVRQWMQGTAHGRSALWLGEWGTYAGGYDDLDFSLNLLKNMIRGSRPGDTYVDGSHLFSLYDWGREGMFEGLVDAEGDRRLSYYAFRMGIRALQGGRPVYLTTTSAPDVLAIATQDGPQQTYLLLVNDGSETQYLTTDVSSRVRQGDTTLWEFSEQVHDQIVAQGHIDRGILDLELPARTSRLVMIRSRG